MLEVVHGGDRVLHISLKTRFIILLVGILAGSLILNVVWIGVTQQQQAENEMREKAYVLNQQLNSVWEFIDINKDLINYDVDGTNTYNRLHYSLVGKSIGKLFEQKTNYVIRFTSFNPRNNADLPDSFELDSLVQFTEDDSLIELYKVTKYKEKDTFRYMTPIHAEESCLDCHGTPIGELDPLGYPKEGWKVGELIGAISLVMPIELYTERIQSNVTLQVAYIFVLTLLIVLLFYFAMSKLVTKPIAQLKTAVEHVQTGNLDTSFDNSIAQGEIRDLSDHFNLMTKKLKSLYNDLEKKVELRTIDLAQAKKILEVQRVQLEEANRRLREDNQYKSGFLAIMSHELRTPLTSIIAFAEVLEKRSSSKAGKEQQIIQEIKVNSQILLRMINDILEMARIEAGKKELVLEPLDLVDVINVVVQVVKPLTERKNIKFSSSVHRDVPLITGDAESFRRIVENLTSNAIKFTPEGGEIKIWVTYDQNQNEVLIHVQDNGIGICKEDQPYIFEKFVQSDSSIHRQHNGSGLGLALIKELIELHGGWIRVESEANKGSLFIVGIPHREV